MVHTMQEISHNRMHIDRSGFQSGGNIVRIKCSENMLVKQLKPFINLRFNAGEVKEVTDEIGKLLLEQLPDKFTEELL